MIKADYPKMYLYKRLVQAKLFMDHHYAEEIDLNKISDEACFSKFHFIRLFKSVYGKTPKQYLADVRIEKAMHLLMNDMHVNEACEKVGFESITSFTTLFKKHTGCSPAAWRKEILFQQKERTRQPLRYIPGCFSGVHK